jgi:HK97 family phage major capsid protein
VNERLRQLIDRKNAIWARMQEIDGPARTEGRDMTAEELQNWTAGETELRQVEDLISQEERQTELNRRMTVVRNDARVTDPERSGGEGGGQARQAAYDRTFTRWLRVGEGRLSEEERSILDGGRREFTAEEQRAFTEDEQRAMSSTTGTAGGYAVPQGFEGRIIEALTLADSVRRAVALCGGTVLTTANGIDIPFPTNDDTGNTGELIGENEEVGEQDLTLGQRNLGAWIYSSKWVKASLALLQDQAVDLDTYIGRMLGLRIGRIQNTHRTTGDNAGKPNGIISAASVGKTAAAAGAITFDELIDLEMSVDEAYRLGGCAWMFKQSTLTAVRKLKDGDGQYIWQPGGVNGTPDRLLTHPYVTNPDMAALGSSAKTVVFGDFSYYQIRDVGGITVVQARERFIEKLQVGFLAFHRTDSDLLDTNAVKVLQQAA